MGEILLANLLQGSRGTFAWASFPSFFAFKEGMYDTQTSALRGWPTVIHDPGLSTAYENRGAIFRRVSGRFCETRATSIQDILRTEADIPLSMREFVLTQVTAEVIRRYIQRKRSRGKLIKNQ